MKLKLQLIFLFFGFLSLNAEDLRLQIEQLSKDISTYKIIDVRPTVEYEKGHIKNALTFPIALTYNDKSVNGRLTEPNKMQEILRKQGLDVNDQVVIYDDGTFFDSARLFWGLEVYGFKNVKLLNGGFNEWNKLNFSTSKETPDIKESKYMLSGLVNGLDSLFIWLNSGLKQNLADYVDLETGQDEYSLAAKDGSLISILRIDG